MKLEGDTQNMAAPIDGLRVTGEAAPKTPGGAVPLSANLRLNQSGNHSTSKGRSYQFVLDRDPDPEDLTITSLNGPTVPVRKMEHLSRVRTANYGITTMDSPFTVNGEPEPALVIEKPHFVICGLPVGSRDIDHHLYVNETKVGCFKTSARVLYQARRGQRTSKVHNSETTSASPEKEMINYNTNLPERVDENGKKSVPPTTPVNYAYHLASRKPKASIGLRTLPEDVGQKFHGSIPSVEIEQKSNDLLIKHRKLTLLRRDQSNDSIELHREHSSVSTRSGKSIETVTESVVTNSLTVTTGKGAKIASTSLSKSANKVNYNNPYRNTKFRERLALNGNRTIEFKTLDSYLIYQRQQNQNGKHIMTPRAVLRIPKPCSDSFLLQMMFEMNRPKSRKSPLGAAVYSDAGMANNFETFLQTRTASSLSKTQANIDRYMLKRCEKSAKSAKSGKSNRSAKSIVDADTIEEEDDWGEENIQVHINGE